MSFSYEESWYFAYRFSSPVFILSSWRRAQPDARARLAARVVRMIWVWCMGVPRNGPVGADLTRTLRPVGPELRPVAVDTRHLRGLSSEAAMTTRWISLVPS